MDEMTMGRAQMGKQVTSPGMKKKMQKVSKKLEKASQAHAGQAKTLKKMIGMKHGGQCKGRGAASRGGKYTVS